MATDAAGAATTAWKPDGSELDFWIGDWDVSWAGDGTGTNRLTRILGGRVIREEFSGRSPRGSLDGLSLSVYDPQRALWRQTWVDDQGSYIDLVGERVDGWFAFGRTAVEEGPGVRQRMVFRDVEADSLRWTWERSEDDGMTWKVVWEIHYKRR